MTQKCYVTFLIKTNFNHFRSKNVSGIFSVISKNGYANTDLMTSMDNPYSTYSNQKINTRISTESELVGIDDFMPTVL